MDVTRSTQKSQQVLSPPCAADAARESAQSAPNTKQTKQAETRTTLEEAYLPDWLSLYTPSE